MQVYHKTKVSLYLHNIYLDLSTIYYEYFVEFWLEVKENPTAILTSLKHHPPYDIVTTPTLERSMSPVKSVNIVTLSSAFVDLPIHVMDFC